MNGIIIFKTNPYNIEDSFSNKSTYRNYADNLIKNCKPFIQQLSPTQNHD